MLKRLLFAAAVAVACGAAGTPQIGVEPPPNSVDATKYSGADMCAQISTAATALFGSVNGAAGGTIDARGFTGAQSCAGSMFASWPTTGTFWPVTILAGNAVPTFSVPQVPPPWVQVVQTVPGTGPAWTGPTAFNNTTAVPSGVSGTNYYLASPSGSGTACTLAAPCTLAQAQTNTHSAMHPVYLRAGTYTLTGSAGCTAATSGLELLAADAGATYSFWPPDGPNTAVLNGATNTVGQGICIYDTNNITVNGIAVAHVTTNGINVVSDSASATHDITIVNTDVSDVSGGSNTSGIAITIGAGPGAINRYYVTNNVVHKTGWSGIVLSNSNTSGNLSNGTVADNFIFDVCNIVQDCGGIYFQDFNTSAGNGSGISTGVSLIGNYVQNQFGAGIYLDDGTSNVLVASNVLTGAANKIGCVEIHNGSSNTLVGNICDIEGSTQNTVILGPSGAITGTTNGTTAAGNATLHFASTPASITGLYVADLTNNAVIPPNTTVSSVTGTTAVMSNNAIGAGVGGTDTIYFVKMPGTGNAWKYNLVAGNGTGTWGNGVNQNTAPNTLAQSNNDYYNYANVVPQGAGATLINYTGTVSASTADPSPLFLPPNIVCNAATGQFSLGSGPAANSIFSAPTNFPPMRTNWGWPGYVPQFLASSAPSWGCLGGVASGANIIDNGDFAINQAFANASLTVGTSQTLATSLTRIIDRWFAIYTVSSSGGTAPAAAQVAASAGMGSEPSEMKLTTSASATTSATAGMITYMTQSIEGSTVADLNWGTATAQPLTVSIMLKSSLSAQVVGVSLQGAGTNQSYVSPCVTSYTAGTAMGCAFTVPGPTSGTWSVGQNTVGLALVIAVQCGSTFQTAQPLSWQTGTFYCTSNQTQQLHTANATLEISQVKIERGRVPTPFVADSSERAYAKAQRWLRSSFTPGTAFAQSVKPGSVCSKTVGTTANTSNVQIQFNTPMGASPAVTTYSPGNASANWWDYTASAALTVAVDPQTTKNNYGFSIADSGAPAAAAHDICIQWSADAGGTTF